MAHAAEDNSHVNSCGELVEIPQGAPARRCGTQDCQEKNGREKEMEKGRGKNKAWIIFRVSVVDSVPFN